MRVIVGVFCFIALAQCYPNEKTIENYLKLLSPITSRIETWILNAEKSCPESLQNYTKTVHLELEACLHSSNVKFDNFCTEFNKDVERCFTPPIDHYTKCLPEINKDFPRVLFKAFISASKYLCGLGDNYFEITEDCVNEDKQQWHIDLEYNIYKYKLLSDFPTKSDFCKYGIEAKSCFQQLLKNSCQDNVVNFYNAFFSEC